MKKNKNILILSLTIVVLITSSCSDFLNVNTDPNRTTDNNIIPTLIFTQAENAIGNRQATRFNFLNNWMGYWSTSGTFALDKDEVTYKLPSTFSQVQNLWNRDYDILFDLYQVKTKGLALNDSVLTGASIVLSTKIWQEQVDMFGDSPYSQTFDYVKYPHPTYDKASDIYTDLLVQLDKAIVYLNAVVPLKSFTKADIIFSRNGDLTVGGTDLPTSVTLWKKFANTLKLRIYLRQSEKGFVPSAAQLAKIATDGGVLGVGENVSVQPGYSNAQDKQNPFYANVGLTPSGAAASSLIKANNYFIGLLKVTSDPRLDRLYKALVTGTDYGALNGRIAPLAPGESAPTGSDIGPGLANSSAQDQWILPAYESLFFQAEAAQRGWAIPGTAQTLYESAVASNFKFLGLADSLATSYLKNDFVSWTIATNKLALIAYEKYLALNGVDPLESYSDYRRLGKSANYLKAGFLSNSSDLTVSDLPYVLIYPQTEYTTNSANVPARTSDGTFTQKLFWQP